MSKHRLNPESPIPLYHQLAEILREAIRCGRYPEGSRIPSEHALADMYGIGRPTARQATEQLIRQGKLVRRRGSGTYVTQTVREIDLFSLAGTLSAFKKQGIRIDMQVLVPLCLQSVASATDNPFNGASAYFSSRLSLAEGEPVLIEDLYLDADLFTGIDGMGRHGQSLSHIVEARFHLRPTGGKQNFTIVYLDRKRARLMGVDTGTPILAVKRWLHFSRLQNAIYSELYCRTDRFVFSQFLSDPSLAEANNP